MSTPDLVSAHQAFGIFSNWKDERREVTVYTRVDDTSEIRLGIGIIESFGVTEICFDMGGPRCVEIKNPTFKIWLQPNQFMHDCRVDIIAENIKLMVYPAKVQPAPPVASFR